MASVKENLITAKALIDTPEKWGKGGFVNSGNCLCAVGALGMATSGNPAKYPHDAWTALVRALPKSFKWCGSVSSFNDEEFTSHADIMALYDRAIEASE